jgi:DNA-binding transcriptional regulator YiaG
MLGKFLTEARLRLGLTREALAYRLKISLGTLINWERRRTKPSCRFWRIIHSLLLEPVLSDSVPRL